MLLLGTMKVVARGNVIALLNPRVRDASASELSGIMKIAVI